MKTPSPEIRQALDKRLLETLPGLGLCAADVAWPNAAFEPKTDRLYLRPTCMFGTTEVPGLGPEGVERLRGIYQVDVFGLLDTGMSETEEIARGLVDAFRGGTRLPCCGHEMRISKAYPGTARKDNGRLHIPVSVVWSCDTHK